MSRANLDPVQEARSKRKSPFKQVLREDAYDVSRYQPAVKLMLEVSCFLVEMRHVDETMPLQEHISGKLDRGAFPYISAPADGSGGGSSLRGGGGNAYSSAPTAAPTSLRSARPRWTAGTKSKASNEPRQRLLVFVAGGVTYSEIRSAYQVSEANQKDVYIGMSSFVRLISAKEEQAPHRCLPPRGLSKT